MMRAAAGCQVPGSTQRVAMCHAAIARPVQTVLEDGWVWQGHASRWQQRPIAACEFRGFPSIRPRAHVPVTKGNTRRKSNINLLKQKKNYAQLVKNKNYSIIHEKLF